MAIGHVQQAVNKSGSSAHSAGNSLAASFGAATTAGNLIVVTVCEVPYTNYSSYNPLSISDNGGNTYTQIDDLNANFQYYGGSSNPTGAVYYCANANPATTITAATPTDPNYSGIGGVFAHEYSGVKTVSPLEVKGIGNNYSSTTFTITLNPLTAGDMIYTACYGAFSPSNTTSGFVSLNTANWAGYTQTDYFLELHNLTPSSGSVGVTYTASNNTSGYNTQTVKAMAVAFLAAPTVVVSHSLGMMGMGQ